MRYEWMLGDIVLLDGVPVARLETVDGELVVVLPGGRESATGPAYAEIRTARGRRLVVVRDGLRVADLAPARPLSRRPVLDCTEPVPVLQAVRLLVLARRRWVG